jgi:hypothetical protein
MRSLSSLFTLLALMLALATTAYGVKLYKWVDKNGHVTYQDRPPSSATATVEEKDIDPNQNRADSYVPPPSSTGKPSAADRGNAVDEVDASARRRAAARRHRRTIEGGGAAEDAGAGGAASSGVSAAPPAPPAPPASIPAGSGGG